MLTRTMKKVEKAAGGLKKRIRDRMRSVNEKVIAIALAGRLKRPEGEERRVERYRELVSLTRKIVHQAECPISFSFALPGLLLQIGSRVPLLIHLSPPAETERVTYHNSVLRARKSGLSLSLQFVSSSS